jgi:hypothetical protein
LSGSFTFGKGLRGIIARFKGETGWEAVIPGKADGKLEESTSAFPPYLRWVEPENAKAS